MTAIDRSTLRTFIDSRTGHRDHAALKSSLDAWFHEARRAEWRNSADVKTSYATASILGADRVAFNIKGNAYRLVVAVDYEKRIVSIKWLGTHQDYDEIDVTEVNYDR